MSHDPMPHYRHYRWPDLPEAHRGAWREMVASHARYRFPNFWPEYLEAFRHAGKQPEFVAAERNGRLVGLLPFERDFWNIGHAVGRRLTDFQGWIRHDDHPVEWEPALRAARLRGWSFSGNIDLQSPVSYVRLWTAPYLDLKSGFQSYCTGKKKAGSETVEKTQRKMRSWSKQHEIRFDLRENSPHCAEKLVQWKQERYRRDGISLPLERLGVPQMWRYWMEQRTPGFEGLLSVLWCDGVPAAIGYSLRSQQTAWCWFLGFDEGQAKFSPGLIFVLQLAEQLNREGVTELHLGRGSERFKTSLATDAVEVSEGMIGAGGLMSTCLQTWCKLRHQIAAHPVPRWIRAQLAY